MDFQFNATADGVRFKRLSVIAEHSHLYPAPASIRGDTTKTDALSLDAQGRTALRNR